MCGRCRGDGEEISESVWNSRSKSYSILQITFHPMHKLHKRNTEKSFNRVPFKEIPLSYVSATAPLEHLSGVRLACLMNPSKRRYNKKTLKEFKSTGQCKGEQNPTFIWALGQRTPA